VLHALGELSSDGHVFPRRRLVDVSAALEDRAVYLASLHTAERGLAALVRALLACPYRPIAIDVE